MANNVVSIDVILTAWWRVFFQWIVKEMDVYSRDSNIILNACIVATTSHKDQ